MQGAMQTQRWLDRAGGRLIQQRRVEYGYKVRVCKHCRIFWHRDVNAAINMWDLGLRMVSGRPRPCQLVHQ